MTPTRRTSVPWPGSFVRRTSTASFPATTRTYCSGSQGFSICRRPEELPPAVERARSFSRTDTVLVEDYIPYDSAIIHYTLAGGEAMFCGISDKRSMLLGSDSGSVMALQRFPSVDTAAYLACCNGMHDGPVWIEAFNDHGRFIFNEMGYRFGGSMTYYPVRYFYGVDQLECMLRYALGEAPDPARHTSLIRRDVPRGRKYAILPLHVLPGVIRAVYGEDEIRAMEDVYAYVPIHRAGDTVRATGTVQQVFCYLHLLYDDEAGLAAAAARAARTLRAVSAEGEDMLFQLYRFS